MKKSIVIPLVVGIFCASAISIVRSSKAVELNPAAVVAKTPDQIPWKPLEARGIQVAVLSGDPSKPGPYVVMARWTKGNHFSHPHFHPNDRFITVLSGTWYIGSGSKFDPENGTVAMKPGSFVTHYGKQVHWDGAKDEDAVILIVGDGPSTETLVPETN